MLITFITNISLALSTKNLGEIEKERNNYLTIFSEIENGNFDPIAPLDSDISPLRQKTLEEPTYDLERKSSGECALRIRSDGLGFLFGEQSDPEELAEDLNTFSIQNNWKYFTRIYLGSDYRVFSYLERIFYNFLFKFPQLSNTKRLGAVKKVLNPPTPGATTGTIISSELSGTDDLDCVSYAITLSLLYEKISTTLDEDSDSISDLLLKKKKIIPRVDNVLLEPILTFQETVYSKPTLRKLIPFNECYDGLYLDLRALRCPRKNRAKFNETVALFTEEIKELKNLCFEKTAEIKNLLMLMPTDEMDSLEEIDSNEETSFGYAIKVQAGVLKKILKELFILTKDPELRTKENDPALFSKLYHQFRAIDAVLDLLCIEKCTPENEEQIVSLVKKVLANHTLSKLPIDENLLVKLHGAYIEMVADSL